MARRKTYLEPYPHRVAVSVRFPVEIVRLLDRLVENGYARSRDSAVRKMVAEQMKEPELLKFDTEMGRAEASS